ncbi:anchor protein [Opitutaceae bacterium TAV5]|nr:anchor protein [Opitutaceae bacterium TAV5]
MNLKMKSSPRALILTLVSLLGAASACATVVFTDNFDAYATGSQTSNANWKNPTVTTGQTITIENDSSDYFGTSTTNRYLSLVSGIAGSAPAAATTMFGDRKVNTGTLSFDFRQPAVANAAGNGWMVRILSQNDGYTGNDHTSFAFFIQNGALYAASNDGNVNVSTRITDFSIDQTHSISVVFNYTATGITYGNNDQYSLAAGKMDVWLDGSLVGTALAGSGGKRADGGNKQTYVNIVDFTAKQNFIGSLYVDNLNIDNTAIAPAAVPEPAALALFAGAIVFALAVLRRCK